MKCDFPELLANLNPLGVESQFWKSRGDIPLLEPNTIAYALSHVKTKGAGYLLRIKYAGEDQWWSDLEYALYFKVIDIATKRSWKTPKQYIGKEPFRRGCKLAIWEKIHPHICPTCLGRAQAMIGAKLEVCGACGGIGRFTIDDQKRLELLSITNWPEYPERYSRMLNILTGWELDGLSSMAKAMYGK
jgi:hypothetical protein